MTRTARPAALLAIATATATLAAGLVALGAPPASAASCGTTWGSLPKQAAVTTSTGELTAVRTGRQTCYDRVVLDVAAGSVTGYFARYVPAIRQDGSGNVVPVRGGAALEVVAIVPAYVDGRATYSPANPRELANVTGYRTFRQVVWAGTFEGHSTVGVGVRARLPFRVLALPGPGTGSRLVVDVAHSW